MKLFFYLLKFYYRLVGNKLCFLFVLMVGAVSLQGLSLGLFLPVLQTILQGEDSGGKIIQITREAFAFLGLPYSLFYLLLVLVIFSFLRSLFLIGQDFLVGKIMAELLVKLRCRISRKIFGLKYQAFLKKTSGYLNNALIVEFRNVVFSFNMFSRLLVTIFFALMYLGFALFLNTPLVVLLIVIGIPFFLVAIKINTLTKSCSIEQSRYSAGLQKILIQSLNYFKYLKATLAYPKVLEKIYRQSQELGKLQIKLRLLATITRHGFEPLIALIIASILIYYDIVKRPDVMGSLFLLYLLNCSMSRILGIQQKLRKLLNSWGSLKVLEQIEAELDELKESPQKRDVISQLDFAQPIKFKNVNFAYDKDRQILKGINFEILAYSTVAFVGDSGQGKTTLANLLIGLFRPTHGTIFVGDIPHENFDIDAVRANVGYITQESVIFNDTIYNNITLWDLDRSQEKENLVKSVAQKAHIDRFISGLKDGYETILGEGGLDISGGQRQRICIARELYKNTKFIIFDEATSSLDTQTEKEIQKNIDEFRGQKTIVLIAHRLSTVRNCDRIFVLKNGLIIEQGTYDELYDLNGEFRRMVDLQRS